MIAQYVICPVCGGRVRVSDGLYVKHTPPNEMRWWCSASGLRLGGK